MVMARDESGAPSNYGAKKSSEYRGSASGVAAAKKKTATRKTVATPGTKVSQATIDKIKAMGMTKALKGAGSASPEMREGIKRLYGASRFNAAVSSTKPYNVGPSKPAAKSADAARAAAMKPSSSGGRYVGSRFVPNTSAATKPSASGSVYKSADAARAAATKTSTTRMGANTVMAKPTVKTSGAAPKRKPATNPAAQAVVSILSGKGLRGNNSKTPAQVAATNAKRMGITVAEYNRRLAAAKKK
jgi:hypothetical protein